MSSAVRPPQPGAQARSLKGRRLSDRTRAMRDMPRTRRLDFYSHEVRAAPPQGLMNVTGPRSVVGRRREIPLKPQAFGGVRDLRLGCDRIPGNGGSIRNVVVHGQPRAASSRAASSKANCFDSQPRRPRRYSQRSVKLTLFGSQLKKDSRSDIGRRRAPALLQGGAAKLRSMVVAVAFQRRGSAARRSAPALQQCPRSKQADPCTWHPCGIWVAIAPAGRSAARLSYNQRNCV
jgi:hypothetical protein